MSIVDARQISHLNALDTDICIVGAGAAGITLAARLSASFQDICLIESGGTVPDEATQALYDMEIGGYPVRQNYMSRARYFGGTCNLWAGRSMVLSDLDMQPRAWVPHSGWPIPYPELASRYAQAASILKLPELSESALGCYQEKMSKDEQALFEQGVFTPTISLWAPKAMRFGAAYQALLAKARNVRVLLHASVTQLHLAESGNAVDSISAATLSGHRFRIRARTFILACGGLENARLLLVSRDRRPTGIANEYDNVGRFFMDHPRTVFGKVHIGASRRLSLLRGRPLRDGKLQLGIGLSAETQRKERLLNHYVTFETQTSGYTEAKYQAFVQTMKVLLRRGHAGSRWDLRSAKFKDLPNMIYLLSPKELMPHSLYRLYVGMREAIPRKPAPKTYIVVYFCEQPPDPESRVVLDEGKDQLGVRKLKLNWRLDGTITRSVLKMQDLLREELRITGVGTLEAGQEEPQYTDASHHMGTTRMSVDPRQGVVDRDCRVHGVENLYIAGSSVFPCAGYANPTLSIVALALRLADHLGKMKLDHSRN